LEESEIRLQLEMSFIENCVVGDGKDVVRRNVLRLEAILCQEFDKRVS
jgi:hypothetical protein